MRIKTFLGCCLFCWVGSLQAQNFGSGVDKINQVLSFIQNMYLDTVDVSKLTDRVIMRTVAELDPHSAFIPAKEVQAVNEELEGSFEGIGVEFSIIMDTLVVVAPVAGGPSEAVGIFAADRIVAVNETSIAGIGLTNQGVYSHLRGPKGTKVSLTVVRKGVSEPLRFVVTRDKIPMNSIDAAYEALPDIAYLRINRFAFTTMTEFIDAISSKFTRKPKGVILDLRGNPGGLMLTALQIAEQFMERGNLLVFTEGMHIERQEEFASGMGFFIKTPVVVLIDEGSASASEILAGALQDWDRGILIGRRSFGKGLVQHALSLVDGSQLRLTVARYHTPTGRVIQTPYTKGDKEGYYQQLLDRYARGELFSKDSIRFLDSLSYRTLVNKRTVYGGGGIMPDIFIPQDTTGYTPYWARIIRGGMVTEFMNTYIDQERSLLSAQYKEFDAFKKHYQLPDSVVENLLNFAEQKGVSRDEEALAISLPLIRTQIKALIARTLFDSSAYVQLINEWNDPAYNMALEVITNWSRYEKEVLGK